MICLPGIFVASIAVEARLRARTYEWPESTLAQADKIAAYGPIVRRTGHALANRRQPAVLSQVADEWIDMASSGALPVLCGSGAGDGIRVGLKSELFASRRRLCIRLGVAAAAASKSDPEIAARDLERVLLLDEIAKYCDFESVSISAQDQIKAVQRLRSIWPRLTNQSQLRITRSIRRLNAAQLPIELLAMLSMQADRGTASLDGQAVTVYGLSSLRGLFDKGATAKAALPMLTRLIEAAKDPLARAYLRQLRRAICSQLILAAEFARFIMPPNVGKSGILARG